MVPARERLDRPAAAAAELDERLEVRLDVAAPDGVAQLVDERVPRELRVLHARREDGAARAAAGLGGVHREVGVAQQLGGGAPRRRSRARRRCSRARARARPSTESGADERAEHALGGALGLDRRRRVLEQHRELVAAEARGEIVLAQRGAQALGDGHEQRVAGGVPERVVDALEVVEVEEHDRRRVVVARERGLDPQREQRAVGEAGERVVARLVRQALLELRDGRQRARGLTALERAAGVRADRLEQAPLARAERLAALDREQADDARVAAQRDDDRRGEAERREAGAPVGRAPARGRSRCVLASSSSSVRSGSVGSPVIERRARSRPSTWARSTRPSARVQDERRAGRSDEQAGVLEQHPGGGLGAGGRVHVAHDREQRLDLRALARLAHVRPVGEQGGPRGDRQQDQREEQQRRKPSTCSSPGSPRSNAVTSPIATSARAIASSQGARLRLCAATLALTDRSGRLRWGWARKSA